MKKEKIIHNSFIKHPEVGYMEVSFRKDTAPMKNAIKIFAISHYLLKLL